MKINNKPDKDVPPTLYNRPKEPIFTYNFILASLVNFFSSSSVTVLLATLPIYIFKIGARQSEVGLIIGMFAITALIVRPFAGIAADVWGRKLFMILGGIGMAVSPLLYIIATSTTPLLGVRILQGLTFSVIGTAATALVADISPPLRRGEAVGYFGMSNNLAMAAGPALGVLIMESVDFNGLFLVSGGLALVSFVFALLVREPVRQSRPSIIHRPPLIVRTALFPTFIFYSFTIGAGAVVTFLPLFATQQGIGNPGLFFTVQALVMVVVRSWTGQLSDRYGRGAVAVPGLLFGAISIALLSQVSSLFMFLSAAVLYAFAYAFIQPALMALVIDRAKTETRGTAMGTFMLAMDAGMGSGALIWGLVSDAWGYSRMYLVASLMPLIGIAAFLWVSHRTRNRAIKEH